MTSFDFQVDKNDLSIHRLIHPDSTALADGQVKLSIERFALTANNITYGVAGDLIGYWQFFPAEENWGRIPVWGVATVSESKCSGIDTGARFYGYYPMSSELIVQPEKITARGFVDASEHRQALPPTYNQYATLSEANGYADGKDNHQMVYRPLFSTAFVLDDFFMDNNFFGAERIMLSSASSKTSFGFAFMLKQSGKVKVTGLTSSGNVDFVKGLGLYDEVVTYEELEKMPTDSNIAFVDMAGNREVLGRIHHHFADKLVYSCGVGITHWDSRDGADPKTLPGAKPAMFFAPSQMQKRNKEWGPALFQEKLLTAWNLFLGSIDDWVTIKENACPESVEETFELVRNGASPNEGMVLVNKTS
jgi:hypothetical protein